MDKQIIIDGVDVSGCEYFLKEHPQNCKKNYGGACSYNPNCYYKQLKRKEQECEELRKIIDKAKNSKLDLNSFFAIEATVGEYQLELEQLKAEKQGLIKDWEEKKNLAYEIACKNEKLKQTLTEIKTGILDIRVGISYFWVTDKCDDILQKISECEGNDEIHSK